MLLYLLPIKQLHELNEIRDRAFSVEFGKNQQARGNAGDGCVQELQEGGGESGLRPDRSVLRHLFQEVFEPCGAGYDVIAGKMEKRGKHQSADGLYIGMQEAPEQEEHEFRFVRVEDLAGLACGGGDALHVEPPHEISGLIVFLHQDGDVGRAEMPRFRRLLFLLIPGLAVIIVIRFFEHPHGAVFRQQIPDLTHHVVRDPGSAFALGPEVMPEAEGTAGIVREVIRSPRRDRNERNILLKENAAGLMRLFQVAVAEHPVDGFDHIGRTSEILRQGVLVVRGFLRLKVGIDVGAPESVDGLLGIADHVEKIGAAFGEAPVENAVLKPVRVLKLVHEHRQVLRPDHFRQIVVILKRRVEIPDDVVIGDHAVPVLFELKLFPDIAVDVPAKRLAFVERLSVSTIPVDRVRGIFRRIPKRFKRFPVPRIAAVKTVPAEPADQAVSVFGFVRDQFRLERVAGFQSILSEHLLTESVNRADRHFIDGADGKPQQEYVFPPCEIEKLRLPRIGGIPVRFQLVHLLIQEFQDAGLQFVRRGFGEGRHQDLPHRHAFQDQAQDEMRDREGLAGPGAGFDQVSAAGIRLPVPLAALTKFGGCGVRTGTGRKIRGQVQRITVNIADFHFLFPLPFPDGFS